MNQKSLIELLQSKGACSEGIEWLRTQPDPKTALKNCPDLRWIDWVIANAVPKHVHENFQKTARPAWDDLVVAKNSAYLEYDKIMQPLLDKCREARESGQPLVEKVALERYQTIGLPEELRWKTIRDALDKHYYSIRFKASIEAIVSML